MERRNFLKALPFLYPLESVSWPPPILGETNERASCRRETLLQDHLLSIESWSSVSAMPEGNSQLSQQTIHRPMRPLFFVPDTKSPSDETETAKPADAGEQESNDTFDPSMCALEMSIQTCPSIVTPNPPVVPAFSKRLVSPTAYQKLRRQDPAASQRQLQETAIFLNIQGQVYQMDLRQIENIDIELSDSSLEVEKPPSLLIQFGSLCVFRIFALSNVTADTYSALHSVKIRLVQLLTAEDSVPASFPVKLASHHPNSPSGSSTVVFSSSNELGQRDIGRMGKDADTPNNKSVTTANEETTSKPDSKEQTTGSDAPSSNKQMESAGTGHSSRPPTVEDTLQDQQAAHAQTHTQIQVLDDLLSRPLHPKDTAERQSELESHVRQLLTSIPNSIAASYCTQKQMEDVLQEHSERMQQCDVELEQVIQSFWSSSKRPRTSAGSDVTSNRPPCLSAEECLERVQEIEEKHRKANQKVMDVMFLPTRG